MKKLLILLSSFLLGGAIASSKDLNTLRREIPNLPPGKTSQPLLDWSKDLCFYEKLMWPVERHAPRQAKRVAIVRREVDGDPRNLVIYLTMNDDGREYHRVVYVYDDGTADGHTSSFLSNILPTYASK